MDCRQCSDYRFTVATNLKTRKSVCFYVCAVVNKRIWHSPTFHSHHKLKCPKDIKKSGTFKGIYPLNKWLPHDKELPVCDGSSTHGGGGGTPIVNR